MEGSPSQRQQVLWVFLCWSSPRDPTVTVPWTRPGQRLHEAAEPSPAADVKAQTPNPTIKAKTKSPSLSRKMPYFCWPILRAYCFMRELQRHMCQPCDQWEHLPSSRDCAGGSLAQSLPGEDTPLNRTPKRKRLCAQAAASWPWHRWRLGCLAFSTRIPVSILRLLEQNPGTPSSGHLFSHVLEVGSWRSRCGQAGFS